jgi:integrase
MNDIEGYFTPEQIDRIIDCAKNYRDKLLIMFCFHTGRRISEVLQVKKKHIDFDKGLILFYILKKKREYKKLKQIDNALLERLRPYVEQLDYEDYLFPSPYKKDNPISRRQAYNIIRNAAETAGIYSIGNNHYPHPHVLRHSFAITFLRNCKTPTIAIKLLQMILEHSDIKITSQYLQFNQDDIKDELNHIFKE